MINKKMCLYALALLFALSAFVSGCSLGKSDAVVKEKLDLAVKYLSENKFDEAVLTYREVIKIDSKNVPAYKGLGVSYSLQGKNDEAEQALQEGIEKVTDKKPLKLAMAGLMVDTGKADQAAAIYNEVISGDAGYVPAYRAYTNFLVSSGRHAEAVALLEKATGGGYDYRLYSLLAGARLSAGNQEGVKDAAVKSLSMEFNQSEAYRALEKMYDGRFDDLISLGDQYIQQGQSPLGYAIKLSGLVAGGRDQEAISLYQQLPEEVKSLARVKLLTAGSYIKSGQKDQGLAILKEIITSDLKDAALVADIAALYLEAGDKGKARELAIAGTVLDDAVVNNYIVLCDSYKDEDNSSAAIWQTRYLVNSLKGVKEAKMEQGSSVEKPLEVSSIENTFDKKPGVKTNKVINQELITSKIDGDLGGILNKSESDFVVGPLSLGMTKAEVISILGQPEKQLISAHKDNLLNLKFENGIIVSFGETVGKENVSVSIYIESDIFSTERNIKVGNTYDDITKAYGKPFAELNNYNYKQLIYNIGNKSITFNIANDNKVNSICVIGKM